MNNPNNRSSLPSRPLLVTELVLVVLPAASIFMTEGPFQMSILLSCLIGFLTWIFGLWTLKNAKAFSSARTGNRFLILIILMEYGAILSLLASAGQTRVDALSITTLALGLLFIVIGNLLGKLSPNSFIGIRTTWALENRENWNYSSRISGIIWVIGGLLCWLSLIFKMPFAGFILILILAFAPLLISYMKYREQVRTGTWKKDLDLLPSCSLGKTGKIMIWIVTIITIVLVAAMIIFGKNYEIRPGSDQLSIRSTLAGNVQIPYKDIESLELKDAQDPGNRDWGYAAFGIDLGHYSNTEYGRYLRYTGQSPLVIEIRTRDETIVCSLDSKEKTEQLFDRLQQKTK
ncbi:hypothetical protein EROP_28730 [Erysipelotrichaceae bacterium OPF54]|nr:hypothetical protein EROP_28730 [Erysipelotrichaceae bacterium OPF54]